MACQQIYDELMSLHLDGMLDADDEHRLLAHIGTCTECTALWGAMNEAHAIFVASANDPLPVPTGFTLRVMEVVSATVVMRPQLESEQELVPVVNLLPVNVSVIPRATAPLGDLEDLPIHLPDYVQEWQQRIATYVRGMTMVGLSVAGAVGVLIALVLSGSLQVGGAFAPTVQVARTFVSAAGTWINSIVEGIGVQVITGGTVVLALLAIVGWQMVSNYHRVASQYTPEVAAFEPAVA